ncbi:Acg family FMN-binding oxidoreductase [Erythrobacter sp. W53]|uniref:Acg family FMN-binding oxidoreductase n=1 Tax=Erythrobacter sp. W53 TaxID=3425947 RepID=UPI003D769C06
MNVLSRRRILTVGLGGAGLIAVGGVWRATRLPQTAFDPWELDATPPQDARLDAFRHAILAPNPHNRQPWTIRLEGERRAVIGVDLDRRLPDTDPFDRQITIGFGAFLETARIAASKRGYAMEIELFPEGHDDQTLDARPVAALTFTGDPDLEPDPLHVQIIRRRSNKEEYDLTRQVSSGDLNQVIADGGEYTLDPNTLAALQAEIVSAIQTEMNTPAANMESVELMRIGHEEVDANPDGIELHGPMIEAGKLAGTINREELADPTSSAFQQGVEMMSRIYGSIPALIWIKTPANTRFDQLEAGRQYVRANLQATALGLGMHPMSQSLQEYAEVQPMFAEVQALTGVMPGERLQMLARVGYGPETGPTPRWPLQSRLI